MGSFNVPKSNRIPDGVITFPDRRIQFGTPFNGAQQYMRGLNEAIWNSDDGQLLAYIAVAGIRGVPVLREVPKGQERKISEMQSGTRRLAAGAFAFKHEVVVASWETDGHGSDPATRANRNAAPNIITALYPDHEAMAERLRTYIGPDERDVYEGHILRGMQGLLGAALGISYEGLLSAEASAISEGLAGADVVVSLLTETRQSVAA